MSQQHARSFEAARRSRPGLRYLLHLPRQHGQPAERRWPLILFLHGAGERGDDLEQLKRHGIPRVVEEADDFPFITVSPQCPEGSFWYLQQATLKGLLDLVMAEHLVDRQRVYLTGLSMGGYGAWHLGARHPDLFAAVVPVCGGGLASHGFPEKVCALKQVPVWAFHGSDDPVVPLGETTRLVERLRACGGQVELTVYQGVGHDSWTRTYANPRLFEWLLEQRRQVR